MCVSNANNDPLSAAILAANRERREAAESAAAERLTGRLRFEEYLARTGRYDDDTRAADDPQPVR